MTLEEEQLIINDLCARLPYGIYVRHKNFPDAKLKVIAVFDDGRIGVTENGIPLTPTSINECKPYLRPMSSMTEEEKEELALLGDRDFQDVRKWYNAEYMNETGTPCPVTYRKVDYCNKNHFDYKGFIPMGLALEAPEGMYKHKIK